MNESCKKRRDAAHPCVHLPPAVCTALEKGRRASGDRPGQSAGWQCGAHLPAASRHFGGQAHTFHGHRETLRIAELTSPTLNAQRMDRFSCPNYIHPTPTPASAPPDTQLPDRPPKTKKRLIINLTRPQDQLQMSGSDHRTSDGMPGCPRRRPCNHLVATTKRCRSAVSSSIPSSTPAEKGGARARALLERPLEASRLAAGRVQRRTSSPLLRPRRRRRRVLKCLVVPSSDDSPAARQDEPVYRKSGSEGAYSCLPFNLKLCCYARRPCLGSEMSLHTPYCFIFALLGEIAVLFSNPQY